MDDLIRRQAAIDLVKDVCNAIMSGCGSHYDEETGDEVFDDILEVNAILKCNKEIRIALKHMPSAQPDVSDTNVGEMQEGEDDAEVVEVVRCKDCKFKEGSCCDYSAVYVRPNGYCQWGERRQ